MPVQQFSLLVQSAGTALLFIVFVLLYQKLNRKAFLDWIASWAFLLGGLSALLLLPELGPSRGFFFFLHACLLFHIFFLLRGVRHFRDDRLRASRIELLWILPVLALSWWTSALEDGVAGRSVPIIVATAIAYGVTSLAFAITPGSPAGRLLLSASFLLWAAERAAFTYAHVLSFRPDQMPALFEYSSFLAMFLEMLIAVGVNILLFEASQGRLAAEMHQLVSSEEQLKEMGIRDPLTGLFNRHYFNEVIRRELATARRYG
ncbi:MAG: GGDEF domain-containing protein, partial [Acidobacteriota bacterium]|nr:GGDEF domain-containing protein [Acidobacteriota bacterium]